jgi:hypothetical protein
MLHLRLESCISWNISNDPEKYLFYFPCIPVVMC